MSWADTQPGRLLSFSPTLYQYFLGENQTKGWSTPKSHNWRSGAPCWRWWRCICSRREGARLAWLCGTGLYKQRKIFSKHHIIKVPILTAFLCYYPPPVASWKLQLEDNVTKTSSSSRLPCCGRITWHNVWMLIVDLLVTGIAEQKTCLL